MTEVRALWRHPIKSHGREALTSVTLTAGQAMPGDRLWAVARNRAPDRGGMGPLRQLFARLQDRRDHGDKRCAG